ncbi:MAG: hypothetical protein ACRD2W_09620 [Acidimicrobiales bacterium]
MLVVRGDELVGPSSGQTHRASTAGSPRGVGTASRLEAWAVVVVFDRLSLEEAGIDVIPTFRAPHVTLAHTSLDDLAERLLACDHRTTVNPYHEPEVGPLEAQ